MDLVYQLQYHLDNLTYRKIQSKYLFELHEFLERKFMPQLSSMMYLRRDIESKEPKYDTIDFYKLTRKQQLDLFIIMLKHCFELTSVPAYVRGEYRGEHLQLVIRAEHLQGITTHDAILQNFPYHLVLTPAYPENFTSELFFRRQQEPNEPGEIYKKTQYVGMFQPFKTESPTNEMHLNHDETEYVVNQVKGKQHKTLLDRVSLRGSNELREIARRLSIS